MALLSWDLISLLSLLASQLTIGKSLSICDQVRQGKLPILAMGRLSSQFFLLAGNSLQNYHVFSNSAIAFNPLTPSLSFHSGEPLKQWPRLQALLSKYQSQLKPDQVLMLQDFAGDAFVYIQLRKNGCLFSIVRGTFLCVKTAQPMDGSRLISSTKEMTFYTVSQNGPLTMSAYQFHGKNFTSNESVNMKARILQYQVCVKSASDSGKNALIYLAKPCPTSSPAPSWKVVQGFVDLDHVYLISNEDSSRGSIVHIFDCSVFDIDAKERAVQLHEMPLNRFIVCDGDSSPPPSYGTLFTSKSLTNQSESSSSSSTSLIVTLTLICLVFLLVCVTLIVCHCLNKSRAKTNSQEHSGKAGTAANINLYLADDLVQHQKSKSSNKPSRQPRKSKSRKRTSTANRGLAAKRAQPNRQQSSSTTNKGRKLTNSIKQVSTSRFNKK